LVIGEKCMGYETFLVEIRLKKNEDKEHFIADLVEKKFIQQEVNQNIYLEKTYATGIVEICVSKEHITFRYAKPNLKEALVEFLTELQSISLKYDIVLYDFYRKKEYFCDNFFDIINSFENCRNEFVTYFPSHSSFPVKSGDVFNKK